ncbi:MAG TPA: bacteriohopanetetrol glucosamine biosynthesis glycosyltransferase HpnI [Bryobacteraceae bacterium]|nr:bacteriohopanetetrol glucosamine biosynthesis glycosyltransferase HpnI [Bryobacteraceae bacterium]
MIWILLALAYAAAAYQIVTIAAALSHLRHRSVAQNAAFGVSILKPVHGSDPGFYEAIRSHAALAFGDFEILFGIAEADDGARAGIERLMAEFPDVPIRVLVCPTKAPNRKAGVLIDLEREARYPVLVVNDADIWVPPAYLTEVTAPLMDPTVGLVTCLYRAEVSDWPSRFEALAIATEFAPSVLVAPLFGVSEFGLGSTLAFRRQDLSAIGGFAAIADYLADDYQLGRRLHQLGRRNVLSPVVVSTRMAAGSWRGAWRHQIRWARTVRLSRAGGYAGLPITFATLWAIAAACAGLWWTALAVLLIRLAMAVSCGWFVLRSADVWKYMYAIPLRDLWGVAIWAAGLFGNTVEWRGRKLALDKQGRIVNV